MPAVDANGVLVGVVRSADVEQAAEERSNRSFLKFMGIVGGEELRTMPLRVRSMRRLSWLSVNIVLNIVAASVIAMHQDTLSAVIALAVFLPIISDMSGCSGNQAVAVSMRELTLGFIKPGELWRVLGKEAAVGVINGIVLGVLLGLVGWAWQGNWMLGAVVAAALAHQHARGRLFRRIDPAHSARPGSGPGTRLWADSDDDHRHVGLLSGAHARRRGVAVADRKT